MNYLNPEINLSELHKFHYQNCSEFKLLVDNLKWQKYLNVRPEEIFIHANLFKDSKLVSIDLNDSQILKMTSSGTTGKRSNIYTDRLTRVNQQRALIKIFSDAFEISIKEKFKYYVVASKDELNQFVFDAQKAAIKGFSLFAKEKIYLLDNNNNIIPKVLEQLKNEKNKFLIFGFTSKVYLNLLEYLKKNKISINAENGLLLHGGGWKKMEKFKINNDIFKKEIEEFFPGIICKNYYGMIEQTGSIFMECSEGFFHSNDFADICIRNNNLEIQENNKPGFIQSISILPKSYPGHSILTEDVGICYGKDTCKCGGKGRYFKVLGRLKKSQLRGCSDVY